MLTLVANDKKVIRINQHILPIFLPIWGDCRPHPQIGISWAGLELELLTHELTEVISVITTSRLSAINSAADEGCTTQIFQAKLGTTLDEILATGRGRKISILDIGSINIKAIKSSIYVSAMRTVS